ncbi:MAG: hypothetical protein ACRD0Y_03540 [Terriglobales bacterium]
MPPVKPELNAVELLRNERRSYIIGSLVVWAVILITLLIILANAERQLFSSAATISFHQAMQRAQQLKLTPQEQAMREIIDLVGALALFFLNWRFSFLLRRPRWAFVSQRPDARFPAARWLWWLVLAVWSLFFYVLLQPLCTWLLAHLGTVEIRERQSDAPPPPAGMEP